MLTPTTLPSATHITRDEYEYHADGSRSPNTDSTGGGSKCEGCGREGGGGNSTATVLPSATHPTKNEYKYYAGGSRSPNTNSTGDGSKCGGSSREGGGDSRQSSSSSGSNSSTVTILSSATHPTRNEYEYDGGGSRSSNTDSTGGWSKSRGARGGGDKQIIAIVRYFKSNAVVCGVVLSMVWSVCSLLND